MLLSGVFAAGCGSSSKAEGEERTPVESKFESRPTGASVFLDGDFVGTTPFELRLPAQDRLEVRIEKAGYTFKQEEIVRKRGLPPDAPPGLGWQPVYYFELDRR